MEMERTAVSQRELDRLRVLHEVKRKQITQIEAARRLKRGRRLPPLTLDAPHPWRARKIGIAAGQRHRASCINLGPQDLHRALGDL